MDRILKGVVVSDHPENVKKSIIRQLVSTAGNSIEDEQCKAIFEMSSEWLVKGETQFERETGETVLASWAKHHKDLFQSFFNEGYLLTFVSSSENLNSNALSYVRTCFSMLQHTSQIFSLYTVVRHRAHVWISQEDNIDFTAAVCRLLIEYSHCWPVGEHLEQFCTSLIVSLSKTELPKSSKAELKQCVQDARIIGALLNRVWTKDQKLIIPVLKAVFDILSRPGPNPSVALATVAQYISPDIILYATSVASASSEDDRLSLALGRMVNWLSWPAGKRVDQWIVSFLRSLAANNKHTILICVTLEKLTKVFSRLLFPMVRESSMAVLSHMLLSFQHSPQAFHQIVENVPAMVQSLKKEDSPSSHSTLSTLAELMHCLMYQHTGFPELYEPLLDSLQDLPKPTEEMIKKWLDQSIWAARPVKSPIKALLAETKSETGKTGLVNLGNTCYMNSVLQALYMLDEFCFLVFSRPATKTGEPILYELQAVFAFLSLTQRPAYAPTKFLTAARPSWFTVGAQQDCSEFLKFLLDKLDIEDKELKNTSSTANSAASVGDYPETKEKAPPEEKQCKTKEQIQTLLDESFAGKLLVNHLCRRCGNVSSREEVFTDLPLAFPLGNDWSNRSCTDEHTLRRPSENFDSSSGTPSTRSLKGGDISKNPASPVGPSEAMDDSAGSSQAAGQGCATSSEAFHFPKPLESTIHGTAESSTFGLETLLHYFLEPEVLQGSNMYYCESCGSLQDAERSVVITKHPLFLVLALKRFSFDVRTQARAKILYHVNYPLSLKLPSVHAQHGTEVSRTAESSFEACGRNKKNEEIHFEDSVERNTKHDDVKLNQEFVEHQLGTASKDSGHCDGQDSTYSLCSVIVHSGTSSDSGHYYCYARATSPVVSPHSQREDKAGCSETEQGRVVEHDDWYLFNDSRVSYASFSSFANITRRFPKDTPYVFIYRRSSSMNGSRGTPVSRADFPVAKAHGDAVQQDNLMYLQERERGYRGVNKRKATNYYPNDEDDGSNGPPGSCGSGAGFQAPSNRFVF